ncbi:hypothetical protein M569_08273, partial [Genlisea aurea]
RMSSLVERLRVRSDRRPVYNLDDSDDEPDSVKKRGMGSPSGVIEKIERPDAKNGSCQSCGKSENLWDCDTCLYAYHPSCLLPELKGPRPNSWKCPEC